MVELINAQTGGKMWVHESRLNEYLAAGHKLAAAPSPPKKPAAKPAEKKKHESEVI